MFWRLHKAIFDTRIQEAVDILTSFGDTVEVVEGSASLPQSQCYPALPGGAEPLNPMSPNGSTTSAPQFALKEASLALTTLQDAKLLLKKDYPSSPWLFYHPSHYAVSYWSARLPAHINYLNRHGVFLPAATLATHPLLKSLVGEDNKVFIRPDSGNKVFTGFDLVAGNTFEQEFNHHMLFVKPDPETLCYVAPYKKIDCVEWRFWICEHQVVASTPYSWADTIDPTIELPASIAHAAQELAQSDFQLDYAYVADFVLDTKGNACLIEVNAASTSGVYSVDLQKLLPALRSTAIREYNMDI